MPSAAQMLAAMGPFWDGNEVWLLASGGVLFLAFPSVLASGLSGFYFAMFLVLWSLVLRGIAMEVRSHVASPLWTAAWDASFAAASTLLPILFGAALGNLIRGLPLDGDGWFSLALFTDFSAQAPLASSIGIRSRPASSPGDDRRPWRDLSRVESGRRASRSGATALPGGSTAPPRSFWCR